MKPHVVLPTGPASAIDRTTATTLYARTSVANLAGLPSLCIRRPAIDATNPQLVDAGTIDGGLAKTAP